MRVKNKNKQFNKALFGSRLYELRKKIGISQEEFANRINRTRLAYLQIESGKTASSASLIMDIVNVLEDEKVYVSLDYLFGRTENKTHQNLVSEIQELKKELKHSIEVLELQKELLKKDKQTKK